MTGNYQNEDPLDAASHAQMAPRSYFGQIELEAWYCVLMKGQGKIPFDPQQHKAEDRRVAIDLTVQPLPEMDLRFALKREMIGESREWAATVWPSLKALGLTATREAKGRWCEVQQVGTGRTYRNSRGEEREATTLQFVRLFTSEDECRTAYLATKSNGSQGSPAPAAAQPANGGMQNGNGKDREIAAKLLRAILKPTDDMNVIRTKIAQYPILSKHFTADSPEVAEALAQMMSAVR